MSTDVDRRCLSMGNFSKPGEKRAVHEQYKLVNIAATLHLKLYVRTARSVLSRPDVSCRVLGVSATRTSRPRGVEVAAFRAASAVRTPVSCDIRMIGRLLSRKAGVVRAFPSSSLLWLLSSSLSLSARHRPALLCPSTVTMPVAHNQTLAEDASQPLYQSAILHLNSLQSNVELLQKLREKRHLHQETNISDTIARLKKCGIEPIALDRLNVIHVSGTKGKGSTCAFVESILRRVGFRTGLYTSPHLVHVRERIRINGKPISEDLFSKYFFTVYNKLKKYEVEDGMPGYFKFLTLLAFHVFLEESVDVAIVEVGIGGEYDNTNIIQHPIVCGVTTLDIDHTFLLGSSLLEIAWQKAGIMKSGAPVIVSPSSEDVLSVMKSRALERSTELKVAPCYQSYSYAKGNISPGIAGDHQKCNMSLALQLSRAWLKQMGFEASTFPDVKENNWEVGEAFSVPATIVEAIESCNWRGRSQIVITDRVHYYLDGAHTPKSMEVCSNWYLEVLETIPTRRHILIFHCTADRDPSNLLPYLTKHMFDYSLFCPTVLSTLPDKKCDVANFNQSAADQRARSVQCATTWKKIGTGEVLVFDCITSAIQWVERLSDTENLDVLVTGSLHLVGGVLSLIEPSVE